MARTILRGKTIQLSIEPDKPTTIIGERCNALGYGSVRRAVEEGHDALLVERARAQVDAGASIINVNMAGMKVEESLALPRAIEKIVQAVDVPISIDFGSFEALERALQVTPGRALINSVNGESAKLDRTLAMAKKYNAAMIGLTCDDDGIPGSAEDRLRIAESILQRAETFGLGVDDFIFDALAIGVATDRQAGRITFAACRLLREKLGANVTLGASNASFGLPKRRTLDAAYLAMAIASGMNVPITDPTLDVLKWAVLCADCAMGFDEYGLRYIQAFRAGRQDS